MPCDYFGRFLWPGDEFKFTAFPVFDADSSITSVHNAEIVRNGSWNSRALL
jgi:hypothetical protein